MVTVRISETYDLSTKVDKMGIVGIHTPRGDLLAKMWSGLIAQYKKFKFVSCDVALACASILPADPLQVGVEAGSIAPQDMFNPLLYKAVSNDSMSNLVKWMSNQFYNNNLSATALRKGSVVDVNDAPFGQQDTEGAVTNDVDHFMMYYSLLADTDGWKKAMPQAGLSMRGLYPLVYQMVSTYGTNVPAGVGGPTTDSSLLVGDQSTPINMPATNPSTLGSVNAMNMRGPPMRLPALDTTYLMTSTDRMTKGLFVDNDLYPGNNGPIYGLTDGPVTGALQPCYVGVIVLPPAKLNQLFYRLKVTWTVEFTGLRPLTDIMTWAGMASAGDASYGTDYGTQSASMSSLTELVDTSGADINKVMEGI